MPTSPRIPVAAKAVFALGLAINAIVVLRLVTAPAVLIAQVLANIAMLGTLAALALGRVGRR